MALYEIKQGESALLDIAIYDDNIPVDLSSATDIKVILYSQAVPGVKYSLTTQVGYGTLTIKASPEEHVIQLQVTREDTNILPIGKLYASVVTKESDIVLTDGLINEYVDIYIGNIKYGNFVKDEILA